MALQNEIERLADQYGGVSRANQQDEKAVRAILEPVLGRHTRSRLRTLSEGLWARSRGDNDRYADLASAVDTLRRTR